MTRFIRIAACAALILSLTACVSREQADAKLAKGCMAAVNVLLNNGLQITSIKETTGDFASEEGPGYRSVTIKTSTKDGWIETNRDYRCLFEEEFGFLNMNYTGVIYQVKIGEQKYGKVGHELIGTVEEFTKISDAVTQAMYE